MKVNIIQYDSINPNIGYNLRLDINGKYICNNSTRILNKNNKDIIRKVAKVVYCKGYKVERIMINVLKI